MIRREQITQLKKKKRGGRTIISTTWKRIYDKLYVILGEKKRSYQIHYRGVSYRQMLPLPVGLVEVRMIEVHDGEFTVRRVLHLVEAIESRMTPGQFPWRQYESLLDEG